MADVLLIMIYVISVLIRICMVYYGSWHDSTMKLKYTDVDYFVFSDAAEHVINAQSPYLRETYRYTPLLAWLLTPNFYQKYFGKLVFILFDIITAIFIHKVVIIACNSRNVHLVCISLWLFNPIVMTISSRGNAESIMAFLVSVTIFTLLSKKIILSGIFFALSIHFKIYPIIYSFAIFLHLNNTYKSLNEKLKNGNVIRLKTLLLLLNKDQIKFCTSAVIAFIMFSGGMYLLYGYEFLLHSYFYHLSRKDIRHNFSVYFYMFYLKDIPWTGIFTFFNQVVTLIVISLWYFRDLPFCCFLLTYAFVIFNKICTSQYFLWYLSLLPMLYPGLQHVSRKQLAKPAIVWLSSQATWLGCAYFLEFVGLNTFTYVWLSGMLFFVCNIYIMGWFIKFYRPSYKVKA